VLCAMSATSKTTRLRCADIVAKAGRAALGYLYESSATISCLFLLHATASILLKNGGYYLCLPLLPNITAVLAMTTSASALFFTSNAILSSLFYLWTGLQKIKDIETMSSWQEWCMLPTTVQRFFSSVPARKLDVRKGIREDLTNVPPC
jgi:hypothetical protein